MITIHTAATSVCAALVLSATPAFGQEHEEHPHAALGTVNFPISCTPEAQRRFNVAAAALYSFYWEAIDAALAAVLEADPSCAMVYWAKAVARLENPLGAPPTPVLEKEGVAAVEKAKQLGGKTQRERDYIAAVDVVYRDYATVPFQTRAAAYEKALEQLYRKYPQDSEAAVLYAYWLQVTADRNDQTFAQQLKSGRILEKVFAAQPEHPGAIHFLIHAYDFTAIADRGLEAARQYALIAPDSPHAQHMPSHIFSRRGQWEESIQSNIRSRASSKQDRDAYHALDYLAYASLQLGRDAEAKRWVEFVYTAPKPNEETRQIAYACASIPARYALERGDWAEAAKLELHPTRSNFGWTPFPEGEAVNAYARGLGAARSGDAEAAKKEIGRLTQLRKSMVAQKKDYWVDQTDIQIDAISAWIANAEKRHVDAMQLTRAAADHEDGTEKHIMMPGRIIPVREMLGELLLALDRPADALAAFEASQRTDPKRFRSFFGAAYAAELAGDRTKARAFYAQLVQQVEGDGSDRVEVRKAKAFLREH
ncbi:MAG: hypothetical protein ABW034_17690 [Steroidobacteraceae bacterium]